MCIYKIDEVTELRLLGEQHAEDLFALTDENRAHLRQWLPWLDDNKTISGTQKFIKSAVEQFSKNNGFKTGIWFKNRLAGIINYHCIDWINKTTSIGYWLGASYQGNGLVTKACRYLVNHAFIELKLNRIEIRCAAGNKKSRAIPEKLGFIQEGIIRQAEWLYDHFVDHIVYGILASDWQ